MLALLSKLVLGFVQGKYLKHQLSTATRIWAAFRQLSTHIVPPRSNVREARLNTHVQKFDPESLYEPIKFETLQPYLVNKY